MTNETKVSYYRRIVKEALGLGNLNHWISMALTSASPLPKNGLYGDDRIVDDDDLDEEDEEWAVFPNFADLHPIFILFLVLSFVSTGKALIKPLGSLRSVSVTRGQQTFGKKKPGQPTLPPTETVHIMFNSGSRLGEKSFQLPVDVVRSDTPRESLIAMQHDHEMKKLDAREESILKEIEVLKEQLESVRIEKSDLAASRPPVSEIL